ncbi:L-iditol 2-dehydrogenase [Alkalilimnicola ehrlichii]|uniref:L-iditol 2-dehydrogenase n=1 Tax=Alkalilimnicola ehrlichii TaxID=351052 RepID=A0A3E0WIF2_9GAMM|nr:zinc-binding dehydrogenase [Alkalilimnicola ehrlichii]RFA25382.1 L-iditol 2-dehydrogenase [Alkalilimnicola ehrlichii]RFA32558.1 L-iditol 2-dehydrogenase [Alkalilimnicola ehrlichii]
MQSAASQAQKAPQAMLAAVLTEAGHFELQQVPRPQPGPNQVRIRLQGCGICASNIPAFEGREWFQYPLSPGELGHEGWGTIDAIGDEVDHLRVGERVAALSFHAYAEYDIADADKVVRLPPALDGQPIPGEALGCIMNIFRRAQITQGQTVGIVGSGFLGSGLLQLAKAAGARVIAISRSESSCALAERLGADHVVPMQDHWEIIDQVKQLTEERFCERVLECTGKQWPLDLAGELTAFSGRLVIAGFHQDGPRSVNMQLWNWRGIDVVNAHERDPAVAVRGMQEAVAAVADGRLQIAPLLSHRFGLQDLTRGLHAAATRPEGFTKAVLMMEEANRG